MLKNSNAAVIVETRYIPDLKITIEKHIKKLGCGWELYVFHHLNAPLLEGLNATKINLHKNLDRNSYSSLLSSESFWTQIPHEKILIFQHDSMLLRHGIEEFMQWDWIGAPSGGHYNGGLSLRSRSKTLEVIKSNKYQGESEDMYFHHGMYHIRARVAPKHAASNFCCEKYFRLGTLGYHGIHYFHSAEKIKLIKNQYDKEILML